MRHVVADYADAANGPPASNDTAMSPYHLTCPVKPTAKRRWQSACDDEIGAGGPQRNCLPDLAAS